MEKRKTEEEEQIGKKKILEDETITASVNESATFCCEPGSNSRPKINVMS